MHDSSFKNKNFVTKDSLKLNNTKYRLNIILFYSLSLNICECLKYQIYQYNCNRLKNRKHFYLKILL